MTAADLLRAARLRGCAAVLDREPGAALVLHALVLDVARQAHPDGDALVQLLAAADALLPLARAVWDGRAAKGEDKAEMGARP